MKKVYVSLIADLLHAGHVKILKEAAKQDQRIKIKLRNFS